jgi:endonuclease-3
VPTRLPAYLHKARTSVLSISAEDAMVVGNLPGRHQDSFDRMLIAQARLEKLPVAPLTRCSKATVCTSADNRGQYRARKRARLNRRATLLLPLVKGMPGIYLPCQSSPFIHARAVSTPNYFKLMTKRPFDINLAFERISKAIKPFAKAAMFELADDGFDTSFEQLAACIISIRTRDEITVPTARRLFELARTPAEVSRLTVKAIDAAISACSFHEAKSAQIHTIANRIETEHDGSLPCEFDVLTSFAGVGPKCANLVLGIACGKAGIGVDIHVHRVTNRLGYVQGKTPERTMLALEAKLPRAYWVEINRLLMPFGKHICTGNLPRCSTCPVLDMCLQVTVEKHR